VSLSRLAPAERNRYLELAVLEAPLTVLAKSAVNLAASVALPADAAARLPRLRAGSDRADQKQIDGKSLLSHLSLPAVRDQTEFRALPRRHG
jgi:hypothetical protein